MSASSSANSDLGPNAIANGKGRAFPEDLARDDNGGGVFGTSSVQSAPTHSPRAGTGTTPPWDTFEGTAPLPDEHDPLAHLSPEEQARLIKKQAKLLKQIQSGEAPAQPSTLPTTTDHTTYTFNGGGFEYSFGSHYVSPYTPSAHDNRECSKTFCTLSFTTALCCAASAFTIMIARVQTISSDNPNWNIVSYIGVAIFALSLFTGCILLCALELGYGRIPETALTNGEEMEPLNHPTASSSNSADSLIHNTA